ncbi:bacterial low temperature requirement A protein-domain-containing protein [Xylogone sp. PMI_703]|nr:bacterial low temperature requirement A protein-domain-containing protein [Xylogone sp. PMI_703]
MSATPKTGGHHLPHLHHRGRRLRNFILPNGREVHIALSPEEAQSLRQRLSAVRPDQDFDLVISGSPEHLEALRKAHSHHEERREELRQQHGPTFDEFEQVRSQLDMLGSELHMLTDHAVSLDANFSKYGYAAHLRTYDDESTPGSSASSLHKHDTNHEKKDWEAERRNAKIMKIWKKPTVRQYFHKGLIWRSQELNEVQSFELFVDLLYVGIIAINGDHAAEGATGFELLRFSITFIMAWKLWSDLALIISWFETDDIVQRLSVLFIMACLLGLTTNMLEFFNETYSQLIAFYLAARLFMGSYLLILSFLIPMVRAIMIVDSFAIAIPAGLWIASIYVDMPQRLALIWFSIFLDSCGSMIVIFCIRFSKYISKRWGDWLEKIFDFYPAVNIEHKVERTNAFVTLVFGYTVVAIIYQNAASFGVNAFFGKAVLGLVQAFCFNWLYFELDGDDIFTHAIRRSIVSATAWGSIHLPFTMSFVLASAALSKLVLQTDCGNANTEDLSEVSQAKSEPEISIGLRWFYCTGLGIALACMAIISMCHVHKDRGGYRLKKRFRLANRLAVSAILCCLPTAHRLNSLELIGVVTCLLVWVLVLELWGISCVEDSFFGEDKACQYTAHFKVSRRDVETAIKEGRTINAEDVPSHGEKAMGVYQNSHI